jgi:uncharacterized cupredoxin-like copper-binding protein
VPVARSLVSSSHRPLARPAATLAAALVIVALTSCSPGSDTSSAADTSLSDATPTLSTQTGNSRATAGSQAPSGTVLQATEVDFAIELPERQLTAGSYTIEVANKGTASHDLVVEDASGMEVAASELIPPGQSGAVEVTLQSGEYVFYCSVGNHRDMGMEVSVTVV